MPSFVVRTFVPAPPALCFDRCLSVEAHTESMRSSGERAVAGVRRGLLKRGDVVTWRARHFGVDFTMTVQITVCEAPTRFVDEQTRGPFRRWRHEHRFDAVDGGTNMVDVVDFSSPAGPVGAFVNRLFLKRYLRRLIQRRNEWLVKDLTKARSSRASAPSE